jgi:FMN phosphatase YigB (HAD superfamily)
MLGLEPSEAMMVGDNPRNDIEPAQQVGMHTYLISDGQDTGDCVETCGTLEQFYAAIQSPDWLHRLAGR